MITAIFDRREYALDWLPETYALKRFYEHLEEPLIVDCGANLGASSMWFASVFPRARVAAIEPEEGNFALLRRNVAPFRNVHPLHGAIAGQRGHVKVTDPGAGEWGYRTAAAELGDAEGVVVRAFAVADVLQQVGGTPFILKVDVEGAELDLFNAASPVLEAFPLVVIELHDWLLPRRGVSRPFLRWHVDHERDLLAHGTLLYSLGTWAAA